MNDYPFITRTLDEAILIAIAKVHTGTQARAFVMEGLGGFVVTGPAAPLRPERARVELSQGKPRITIRRDQNA